MKVFRALGDVYVQHQGHVVFKDETVGAGHPILDHGYGETFFEEVESEDAPTYPAEEDVEVHEEPVAVHEEEVAVHEEKPVVKKKPAPRKPRQPRKPKTEE